MTCRRPNASKDVIPPKEVSYALYSLDNMYKSLQLEYNVVNISNVYNMSITHANHMTMTTLAYLVITLLPYEMRKENVNIKL